MKVFRIALNFPFDLLPKILTISQDRPIGSSSCSAPIVQERSETLSSGYKMTSQSDREVRGRMFLTDYREGKFRGQTWNIFMVGRGITWFHQKGPNGLSDRVDTHQEKG